MKLPHKVRVTTKCSYELVWVERFDCDKTLGECRFENKQIALKRGEPEHETFKTFLHELLHAIEFESNTPIPHKVIYKLEQELYRVLKLNKWLPKGWK